MASLVAVLLALGCEGTKKPEEGHETPTPPGGGGEVLRQGGQETGRGKKAWILGKVLEVASDEERTYLRIEWSGRERWVAVPKAEGEVKVGEVITLRDAMPLPTFTSQKLNRRFENILEGRLGMPDGGVVGASRTSPQQTGTASVPVAPAPSAPAAPRTQ